MNQMRAYKAFIETGIPKEKAEEIISALCEMDTEAATKNDLRDLKQSLVEQVNGLEIRVLKEINNQTWRFLGGMAALGIVFKIAEMVIQRLGR